MKEINVEYEGMTAGVKPAATVKKKQYGPGALAVTAAIAVVVSMLLSYALVVLTLPRIIESLGYEKRTGAPGGAPQNVTIIPNGEYGDLEAAAAKIGASVVTLNVTIAGDSANNGLFFFRNVPQNDILTVCSGVVISEDGHIITCYHNIKDILASSKSNMVDKGCALFVVPGDGKPTSKVTVVGYDPDSDIAVLKAEDITLVPAETADVSELRVGQRVAAAGGASGTAICSITSGCISSFGNGELDGSGLRLIKTDALISTSNCGGALINMKGQVVGINCLRNLTDTSEGLGAAIPVDEAMAVADRIIKGEKAPSTEKPTPEATERPVTTPAPDDGQDGGASKGQGFLGIKMDTQYSESIASIMGRPAGVRVVEAIEGLAADKAGIRSQDIITEIDGKELSSGDDLVNELSQRSAGDRVRLKVWRGTSFGPDSEGEILEFYVVLGERPKDE